MELLEWQIECLKLWEKNDFRGIVNVVTGGGKTFFALAAIQYLQAKVEHQVQVKIVVPQIFLVHQWVNEIMLHIGVDRNEIGVYYGSKKETAKKKYMIYVINSARYTLASHVLRDLDSGLAVFLIADECHHYASKENAKIFDFYSRLKHKHFYYALGLSATPQTTNYDIIANGLGKEIFRYSFTDALHNNIISDFSLINIKVSFTKEENDTYTELTEKLLNLTARLRQICPEFNNVSQGQYFAKLTQLATFHKSPAVMSTAKAVLNTSYKRKAIVNTAQERVPCAVFLVGQLEETARIIMFCERIETATLLFETLNKTYKNQVGMYHSLMDTLVRKQILKQYERSEIRILITCKALDEGLNVPSTDIGIVVSSTGSLRQRIQRLGRILRVGQAKKRLYYLYVGQSNEDSKHINSLYKMIPESILNMNLYFEEGRFLNDDYTLYCADIAEQQKENFNNFALLDVFKNNAETALVRGDFCVSVATCKENIAQSTTNKEKNYWISILYLLCHAFNLPSY